MEDAIHAVPEVITKNNALKIKTVIIFPKFSGAPNEDMVMFSMQSTSFLEIGNTPAELQFYYISITGALVF